MRGDRAGPALSAAGLALVGLLAGGCDEDAPSPRTIPGERVARMAEEQLEADHPKLSPGALSCPDLEFVVGASARCARTALLSRGRQVRVLGTISVTSVDGGGKLHVRLDDRATAYGVTGDYLATQVAARLRDRIPSPIEVDCPDLPGEAGARAACVLSWESGTGTLRVNVTRLDPASYRVDFRMGPLVIEAG